MATLYANANYDKKLAVLGYGNYNSSDLKRQGIINNKGESVLYSYKIPSGYKMILYSNGDFTGASDIRYGNNQSMTGPFGNNTRSIQVLRNLVSNEHFSSDTDTDNNKYFLLLLLIIFIFFACRK